MAHNAPKRRKWPWVLGGLALLVIIIAAGSGGSSAPPPTPAASTPSAATTSAPSSPTSSSEAESTTTEAASPTYTYKITGRGQASLTYTSQGGNMAQSTGKLPWRKTVPRDEFFSYGSVSASVMSGSGELSCTITDETGRVLAENTSEGGSYASVTCTTTG